MREDVIAAASVYEKKYFLNPRFKEIPTVFQEKIHKWIVPTSEKIHGILLMGFEKSGEIYIEYSAKKNDFSYDEIGAALEVKKFTVEQKILLSDLKLWYITNFKEEGKIIKEIAQKIKEGNSLHEVLEELKQKYDIKDLQKATDMLKNV